MPTAPTVEEVTAYLGDESSYTSEAVAAALAAEIVAQSAVVKFPADPELPADPSPYPADLAEALCRRVQRLLNMRALPLGYQSSASEFGTITTRVGADPEIRRLEAPHRKLVVG